MRELAILTFQTLDGVMQAPRLPEEDLSDGFECGGWAVPCWGEVMKQVREHATAVPYDLLLGRKTYELFASHWPSVHQGDPEADRMNQATKYVATSTLERLEWQNSKLLTGDIPARVARLKGEDGPLIQVHGSWQLVQTLVAHDLVDEFRLWTFPVVVGSGKRLFGQVGRPAELTLIKSEACSNGAVMSFYRRFAGDATPVGVA